MHILKQEVNSFGIYIKSDCNNLITSQYVDYVSTDANEKFVERIISIYDTISKKLHYYSNTSNKVKLTVSQKQQFNTTTNCYICNIRFTSEVT